VRAEKIIQMKSDNLLTLLEYHQCECDNRPATALIYEDFSGERFDRYVKHATVSINDFFWFARQIIIAMMPFHDREMLLSSVRPSSFAMRTDRAIVCIDVGLASIISHAEDDIASELVLRHVLPYISPEKTGRTKHAADRRSDLYSLGTLLFELLTGSPPFIANDPLNIVHGHLARTPILPAADAYAEALFSIVAKLLEKLPDDRYQSLEALLEDIAEIEEH
jgi:serine/threonine protein kinase